MSKKRIIMVAVVLVVILAYAWIDGGREPVKGISQDLSLPGATK